MSTFTVKSVMSTGKTHATYGTEFYVQFNEVEQAFPLWFKSAPEIGTAIDGEINGGKFKKIKKEYTPNTEAPAASTQGGASSSPAKPAYKDNSDGMRQGMCFNNAANYVATLRVQDRPDGRRVGYNRFCVRTSTLPQRRPKQGS
jgi:hypothetical protein